MAYSPFTWQDEVPASSPLRFRIRKSDGTVLAEDATIELVTGITAQGTPVNATRMNALEQGLAAAHCRITTVELSGNKSYTPNSDTPIEWDTETLDDLGGYTLSDPSKITISDAGIYYPVLFCKLWPSGGATTVAILYIKKNGQAWDQVPYITVPYIASPFGLACDVSFAGKPVSLAAGDYIQAGIRVTSGTGGWAIHAPSYLSLIQLR